MKKALYFALVIGIIVVGVGYFQSANKNSVHPKGSFSLLILHTNDVHARLEPFNKYLSDCSEKDIEDQKCFGGAARRAFLISKIRNEAQSKNLPVLLLDGGDQFQGSLFFTKYKGIEAQSMMNLMKYDGMAVGNHEFDEGADVLARFIRGAQFPVLSANIVTTQESPLHGLISPHQIVERHGEKIGLVGFTTEDTATLSNPGEGVQFLPIEESAQKSVDALKKSGVTKVIGLSHSGFSRDIQVAEKTCGIDVIISGHTNTYLSNSDQEASGPYPVEKVSKCGEPVLVVSAFAYGKYLGHLEVQFDSSGRVKTFSGDPLLITYDLDQDESVKKEVERFAEALKEFRETVLAVTDQNLIGDSRVCRFQGCSMGNLITDALLWESRAQGAEIALMNAGGIRASIPQGEVTLGQVLEVFPFANQVSTLELKGSDLVVALENGLMAAHDPNADGTGRFPHVSGMRYTWSPKKAPGSRVLRVEVKTQDGKWEPLNRSRWYKVVTNSYIRNGGDRYTVLKDKARNAYDGGAKVSEVFSRYLQFLQKSAEKQGKKAFILSSEKRVIKE